MPTHTLRENRGMLKEPSRRRIRMDSVPVVAAIALAGVIAGCSDAPTPIFASRSRSMHRMLAPRSATKQHVHVACRMAGTY